MSVDIYIKWRIEGLNGLAIGDVGWCQTPYTPHQNPLRATRGSELPGTNLDRKLVSNAFIGTMAQLLIALETKTER